MLMRVQRSFTLLIPLAMGSWLLHCAPGLRMKINYSNPDIVTAEKTGLAQEPQSVWEKTEKSPLAHLIMVNPETLLVLTSRGEFYAVQLATGKRLTRYWRPFNDPPVVLAIDPEAETLYVTTARQREVFAYWLPQSRMQWKQKYAGLRGAMVIRGEHLQVIQNKQTLLVLERRTGKQIAQKKLSAAPSAGLFRAGAGLALITESGELWIMNNELKRVHVADLGLQPFPVWRVHDGFLIAGDSQGRVIVYSLPERSLIFEYQCSGPIYSAPLMIERQLIVPVADGRVKALDISQNKLEWQYQSTGLLNRPLWAWNDLLLIPYTGGQLICLERQTGAIKWQKEFENTLDHVVLTPQGLLVTDQKRNLFFLK